MFRSDNGSTCRPGVGRLLMYLCIFLFLGLPSGLLADSCPYCGRTYGGGAASGADSAYIQKIRASHEATCSARNRDTTIYADDLSNNNQHIGLLQQQINRSLAEVNSMVLQLSAGSKQLFSQLRPQERSSLEKAMNALLEDYFSLRTENTNLNARVSELRNRLNELEIQLHSAKTKSEYLVRSIGESNEELEALRAREAALKADLESAVAAETWLNRKLQSQREATEQARKTYWAELAGFITRHDLGSPRQYMKEIPVRSAYATRGTVVLDNRVQPYYPLAVAASAAIPVQAVRTPLVSPARAVAAAPALSAAEFERVLKQTRSEMNRNDQLRSWVSGLLIDTDRAQARLQHSIQLEQERRQSATYLKTKVSEVKDAVSLYLWDLEIRTRDARETVSRTASEWKDEQKWDLLKETLGLLIRNKAGTRSAYATASLAKDLLNGDLTKLPDALADDTSEEARSLLRKMENWSDDLGKSFYENLFDYSGKPLPGQKWVEKILGRTGP